MRWSPDVLSVWLLIDLDASIREFLLILAQLSEDKKGQVLEKACVYAINRQTAQAGKKSGAESNLPSGLKLELIGVVEDVLDVPELLLEELKQSRVAS